MQGHSRRRSVVLVLLLAVGLACPAFAQVGEQTGAGSFTVGGPVTSVDAAKHTITIGGATGGTFEVDPNATVMSGGKKLKLGDIKPGWYVDGNGELRGATNPKKVITYLEEVDQANKGSPAARRSSTPNAPGARANATNASVRARGWATPKPSRAAKPRCVRDRRRHARSYSASGRRVATISASAAAQWRASVMPSPVTASV